MTSRQYFVWVVLGLLAGASLGPVRAAEWEPLFNGYDLSAWEGEQGFWRVERGVIVGETTPDRKLAHHSYLVWRGGTVGNFELRLQFRLKNGNSGVQYRSRELADFEVAGYQCNIEPSRKGFTAVLEEMKNGRGGHLAEVGQRMRLAPDGTRELLGRVSDPNTVRNALRKDDWNTLAISAQGDRLRHWLNGQLVVDVIDQQEGQAAHRGILALQLHAGHPMKVEFKDLHLRQP